MKVLVIGGGGREHALAWKIAQSPKLTKLYSAPGNAGMSSLGECVSIKADDVEGILEFVKKNKIGLTVVGPEAPLVKGIVNRFEAEGLRIFGPRKEAAQLEGSKVFSKQIMLENRIPTAECEIFSNANEAKRYVENNPAPLVLKADGLAAGKGVVVAHSPEEAASAVDEMLVKGVFGEAGRRIIIEKCLSGQELSVLVLTDGERLIPLASSQDHKRALDHDQGPNTGGMGAYSPCPLVDDDELRKIVDQTAVPVIRGLKNRGVIYRGVLYVGLMLTNEGPYVLEYNARFGDPETQAVLPRLKSDLLLLLAEVAEGKLRTEHLEWDLRSCLSVVLTSGGYPGSYETGYPIEGLKEAESVDGVSVFHAGTKLNERGQVCTAGGRVLDISALGANLKDAYGKAYCGAQKISFKNLHYRKDIGGRMLFSQSDVSQISCKS